MKCPVCKVTTIAVEHDKIELDYCSVCHGLWFDRGELELLLDALTGGTTAKFINGIMQRPHEKVDEKTRKCPICSKNMYKTNIGSGEKIIIDICNAGHGLWFDGGESGALIRQLKPEGPAAADSLYETLFFIRDTFRAGPGAPGSPG